MSDWRSRAKPVEAAPDGAGWRARAQPIAPPEETGPGRMEALGRGAVQGASFGFGDELGAGWAANLADWKRALSGDVRGAWENQKAGLKDILGMGKGPTLASLMTGDDGSSGWMRTYRGWRDDARENNAAAEKAHGGFYLGGELLGGALVPIPGAGAAKGLSVGARLAQGAKTGAKLGALFGLGNSEADLTKGEFGGAAVDTGLGAAFGAGGGVAAEGLSALLSKGLSSARARASAGIRNAVDQETAAQAALAEKSIRGAQGEYRSAVQSASRDLEVLERAVGAMPDSEVGQRAAAFLQTAEGKALREAVASNKLTTAPERISEMAGKQTTLADLVAGKDVAVQAQTAEALANPLRKHVLPRVWTLGHRFLPLLGPAVGGAAGEPWLGLAAGAVMSITQGAPGRIIRNLKDKPAVRKAFWEKVLSATSGPQNARVVAALERASAQGTQAFEATAARLAELPEAREVLLKVAELARGADEEQQPMRAGRAP